MSNVVEQAPTLATLPSSRRQILQALKKRGEMGAEELADQLGLTASGVRQHLAGLAADGLVAHRSARERGPGRPRHCYHLTPGADSLFPRAYSDLANELLGYAGDEEPALVERLFEKRRRRRVDGARERLAGLDFAAKVAELARILDQDGYLADFEALPDGTFRVTEHNCAILGVARRYGQACASEIEFLRDALPEATIERVQHMIAGQHACSYEIRPKRRRGR